MFQLHLFSCQKDTFRRLAMFILLLAFAKAPLVAEITGPGWHNGSAASGNQVLATGSAIGTPISISEPMTVSAGPLAGRSQASSQGMQLLSVGEVHPEIVEVAKALGNDPLTIFNWVRNKIDYVHYRGAKKGSLMTLVESSGNDYDQSLLLRDLLRAAGYSLSWFVARWKFLINIGQVLMCDTGWVYQRLHLPITMQICSF